MRCWKCKRCNDGPCWTSTRDDGLALPVCGCLREFELDADCQQAVWSKVDTPLAKLSELSTFLRMLDEYESEFSSPECEWLWDAAGASFDSLDAGAKDVARMLRYLDEDESWGNDDIDGVLKKVNKREVLRGGVSSGFFAGVMYAIAVQKGWREPLAEPID